MSLSKCARRCLMCKCLFTNVDINESEVPVKRRHRERSHDKCDYEYMACAWARHTQNKATTYFADKQFIWISSTGSRMYLVFSCCCFHLLMVLHHCPCILLFHVYSIYVLLCLYKWAYPPSTRIDSRGRGMKRTRGADDHFASFCSAQWAVKKTIYYWPL